MRAWHRAKTFVGIRTRPVQASGAAGGVYRRNHRQCNLYCPMCPRETHLQPKADMSGEVFESVVRQAGDTPST